MKKEIAKKLLEIGAVFLKPNDPFTWASGIKSPIYCDNRIILAHPNERKFIEDALATMIKNKYSNCDVIMGTSTAGIPHAAIVGEILELPMGYVRASAKDHGRNNQIEGCNPKGKHVVVIEDLISTAGSVLEVCSVLKEAGANVLGIASIFTYDLITGINNLNNANTINVSLTNFDALIEIAVEHNYINKSDIDKLLKFRNNPQDPSWMN